MGKREERLYVPIMKALEQKFGKFGECYLEVTYKGFSETIKGELEDDALFVLKTEKMSPDLTGYVIESKKTEDKSEVNAFGIVIVEIKNVLRLQHIYQTKRYAEILNASYALLISPKRLSEERRRFLIKRKGQVTSFSKKNNIAGLNHVLIGSFDEATKSIQFDAELYGNVRIEPKRYKVIFQDWSESN